MRRYITLDGGTTNTRLYLVEDNNILDSKSLGIGCGNKESPLQYSERIKNGIRDLLSKNSLSENDIHRILASGMITSELGLMSLAHRTAPAGIGELCENSKEVALEEISKIPFFFISGIKTVGESLEECDIMRGEETELFGIVNETGAAGIYVLPGSHSKIVRFNGEGKITDFKSTLTGEMIYALSKSTILSDCVDISLNTIDSQALIDGYKFTEKFGINAALLKPRVLKNIYAKDSVYTYSFFLGTVLFNEIKAILLMPEKKVTIGGRAEIKHALTVLLQNFSSKEIVMLDEKTVSHSTALGAIKIFEHYEKSTEPEINYVSC